MTFYGYILVSFFNFFKFIKGERGAYYTASMFVGFGQLLGFISLLLFMKKFFGIDWITWMFTSGFFVLLMIGWLVGLSFYFKLDTVDQLQKEFEEKTDKQRFIWGIIAILSIVVPFALLALTVQLPSPNL